MTTKTEFTVTKRPAGERGRTEWGWLDSRHTFSFGEYFDPDHMGYRSLRVINDDRVEPGMGFGTHPHRDTEIFSYVIEGSLQHKDSMGNGSVIEAGDLQYMSAGSGVLHSEFNPSPDQRVHFLQIWIVPNERGGKPRYAEKRMGKDAAPNALTLLFSPADMRQNAEIHFGKLDAGREVTVEAGAGRGAYIHVIKGAVDVQGTRLEPGDGASADGEGALKIAAAETAEFLVFLVP